MKVSSSSITLGVIESLVNRGYEVVQEADSEYVEIHKIVLEDQPDAIAN